MTLAYALPSKAGQAQDKTPEEARLRLVLDAPAGVLCDAEVGACFQSSSLLPIPVLACARPPARSLARPPPCFLPSSPILTPHLLPSTRAPFLHPTRPLLRPRADLPRSARS